MCLISSQILLERLAAKVNHDITKVYSDQAFSELKTAKKVRAVLDWLSEPVKIPEELVNLRSAFTSTDAPTAIVELRNSIIHVREVRCNGVVRNWNDLVFEALQLNLLFSELTFFKLIGFNIHQHSLICCCYIFFIVSPF